MIELKDDKDLYEKAVNETKSILQSSEKIPLRRESRQVTLTHSKAEEGKRQKYGKSGRGYCIRCQDRIEFNPSKPLCSNCYAKWNVYSNPDYIETVCHCCGEFEGTSMNKPLCYDCFKEMVK